MLNEMKMECEILGYTDQQIKLFLKDEKQKNKLSLVIRYTRAFLEKGYRLNQIAMFFSYPHATEELIKVLFRFNDFRINNHFSCAQIISILKKKWGRSSLQNIMLSLNRLENFSTEEIVMLARCEKFTTEFVKVVNLAEDLKELGFSMRLIALMLSCQAGVTNLESVLENFKTLKYLGFSKKYIALIASHNDGSRKVKYLIDNFSIFKKCGVTNDAIASNIGLQFYGSKYFESLKTKCEEKIKLYLSFGDLITLDGSKLDELFSKKIEELESRLKGASANSEIESSLLRHGMFHKNDRHFDEGSEASCSDSDKERKTKKIRRA